jgi:hypothetical protein
MELLLKMRCDHPDCGVRADPELETLEDAIEAGWCLLRTDGGNWEYCSIECLREHL